MMYMYGRLFLRYTYTETDRGTLLSQYLAVFPGFEVKKTLLLTVLDVVVITKIISSSQTSLSVLFNFDF